jgi:hypothetical protein
MEGDRSNMETQHNTNQEPSPIKKSCLDNGLVMLGFPGYRSYEEFMTIYDIIGRVIAPDSMSYSVDSLCIMGNFRKDGILIKMSDEGITENESIFFFYNRNDLTEADSDKIEAWALQVAQELQRVAPKGYGAGR